MSELFFTIMIISLLIGTGAAMYGAVCKEIPTLILSIYVCFISIIGIVVSGKYIKYEKTPEFHQAMIRIMEEKNP